MNISTQRELNKESSFIGSATFNIAPELRPGQRKELLEAIEYLKKYVEDDWNGHSAIKPTSSTFKMAEYFTKKLPSLKKQADRIEPDGDGGILLEWNSNNERVLLTIDGTDLHLSYDKNSNPPIFIDNEQFFDEKDSIPEEILQYIPKKPSNA